MKTHDEWVSEVEKVVRDSIDKIPGFIDLPEEQYLNVKAEAFDLIMVGVRERLDEIDQGEDEDSEEDDGAV